jgi:hypothetical protein
MLTIGLLFQRASIVQIFRFECGSGTKQAQSLSQLKVKHEIAVQCSLSHYEP